MLPVTALEAQRFLFDVNTRVREGLQAHRPFIVAFLEAQAALLADLQEELEGTDPGDTEEVERLELAIETLEATLEAFEGELNTMGEQLLAAEARIAANEEGIAELTPAPATPKEPVAAPVLPGLRPSSVWVEGWW